MQRDETGAVPAAETDDTRRSGLTRREALAALAAAGAAALPFGAAARAAEQTGPPRNLRIVTPPSGGRPVIRPEDLRFLGFIRPPLTAGDLWYARQSLTMRMVGGEPRFFMTDNTSALYEFSLPGGEPNPDLGAAPIGVLRKAWGGVMAGRMLTGGGASSSYLGGIHWDAATNAVWWTYGEGYVPTMHDPSIGATVLNDSSGTYQSFGPWRTQWNSQRTRGAMTLVPPAFASAYTSGKRTGIMSTQSSGNAGSPFGAILSAIDLPDPTRTPADPTTSTSWSITNHGLILHDLEHRQARDTRYKTCGWTVKYDCRAGAVLEPGLGLFSGIFPAAGEDDNMTSCVWIDLPEKHGLLYFGQLVTTPAGYRAPGDPDGFVHLWYGDPFRSDGSAPKTCCHGQDDPWWGATGPGSHYKVPMGWIYDPAHLVATAQGAASLWSRVPTSTFQWKSYVPQLNARYGSPMFGGAVFDPSSRRIYVALRHDFLSMAPHGRPALLVFQVT